jgi:cysteine desulfurase
MSVYLDHNATSPLRPEVRAAWLEALDELHGNPSSLHASGRAARHRLDQARERTAAALGVAEDEVVFTSGGTEANNLALFGVLRAGPAGGGLVTSAVEHSSVLGAARELAREGHALTIAPADASGTVDLDEVLRAASASGCRLVSLMMANNEVGTVQPIDELVRRLARLPARPRLHTDAVQALGRLPVDLAGVDLASFSAHKLGGPLGVGVLVRRAGVELKPLFHGGEQEHGLRPGTENVPAIVAAALAFELAVAEQPRCAERLRGLAAELWREVERNTKSARLLGLPIDHPRRLPGTLDLLVPEREGKVLVVRLDLEGLECSAGSACASGSLEPSHVLLAMGLDERDARAGLRLSFGSASVGKDVREAVEILRRTLGSADAKRAESTGL